MPNGIIPAIIIFVILFAIFIISYRLNKKVPRPDDCQELDENCINCQNPLCQFKQENEDKENNN